MWADEGETLEILECSIRHTIASFVKYIGNIFQIKVYTYLIVDMIVDLYNWLYISTYPRY